MPDPIFERYKEALRAGHVAALRGRPDDALLQYRSAAAIAPDRALPHAGMAEVLLRIGRPDEALAACTVALRLAPHDESVLELAARIHETAGRGADASIHLDRVVDLREKQGRTGDALAAAARSHAADPTDARRDRLAALTAVVEAERARLSNPAWAPEGAERPGTAGDAAVVAEVASPPAGAAAAGPGTPAQSAAAAGTSAGGPRQTEGDRRDPDGRDVARVEARTESPVTDFPVDAPAQEARVEAPAHSRAEAPVHGPAPEALELPDASGGTQAGPVEGDAAVEVVEVVKVVEEPVHPDDAGPVAAGDASPSVGELQAGTGSLVSGTAPLAGGAEAGGPSLVESGAGTAPVVAGLHGPPAEAPVPPPVAVPGAIFVAAEEQAAAGDPAGAAALYVEAAGVYLGMGAVDTAVDACLRALSGAPADTDVHLALARIDLATGHDVRAADRLDLLGRLLSLEGDEAGVARVTAFRAGVGAGRERDGSTSGESASPRASGRAEPPRTHRQA